MVDEKSMPAMPPEVVAIRDRGYATWANDEVAPGLRGNFEDGPIPVKGVRHVRVWGIQVDDERALPGLERTMIPDEDLWEISLVAKDGSTFAFDSRMLKPAP